MAADVTDSIEESFFVLPLVHQDFLAQIRVWSNLKVAFEGQNIWIKDFTVSQWNDVKLSQIPFAERFILRQQLLFPEGYLLPSGKMPVLFWTPIERAIPVSMPALNHNYFGIDQRVKIRLRISLTEQECVAAILQISDLLNYSESAPAIRLAGLRWCLLSHDRVLVYGSPLLPVKAQAYWKRENSLLPAGYDFEFSVLSKTIERKINPENNHWILWNTDGTYLLIPQKDLEALSRSSVRMNCTK